MYITLLIKVLSTFMHMNIAHSVQNQRLDLLLQLGMLYHCLGHSDPEEEHLIMICVILLEFC